MIPLNAPSLGDLERRYVNEALDSGWTTASGPFIDRLEAGFRALTGRRHAVACSSGTAALWLALAALGLKHGDRVLTQSYTCDSVANAVISITGHPPLVLDVEPTTWGLAGLELARALRIRVDDLGVPPKAVTFNHTYGVPSRDTLAIVAMCRARGIPVIEDASEAHGAEIDGRPAGSFGDAAIFSCRGEKTVGGGQLGVVVTDDPKLARKVHQYAHNGLPAPTVRFWSTVPGLNFQPAHLNAALACAQLERLPELVKARNEIHDRYVALLAQQPVTFQASYGTPAWWLNAIQLGAFTAMLPQDLGAALLERGIQTRPGFYPLHHLPHCATSALRDCPVSDGLLRSLLILPSGPTLTAEQQEIVVAEMLDIVGRT